MSEKGKVKARYVIISAGLLVAVVAAVLLVFRPMRYDDTVNGESDFLSERFQAVINSGQFSVEALRQVDGWDGLQESVGPVEDAATVRKEAVKIWNELFGRSKIKGEKPYQVYYDAQNGVWLVCGTLKEGHVGGTAHILIEKENGRIIAVWHEA